MGREGAGRKTPLIDGRRQRVVQAVDCQALYIPADLAILVSIDPMYVYFDVDERSLLRYRQVFRNGGPSYNLACKIWVNRFANRRRRFGAANRHRVQRKIAAGETRRHEKGTNMLTGTLRFFSKAAIALCVAGVSGCGTSELPVAETPPPPPR